MQRIAGNRSFRGKRLAHEARRVNHLDRLLSGKARRHQLASAAEPQHQVLFNKSQRDVQIRRHEPFVDINRRSAARRSQVPVLRERARIVTDHAIGRRNLRPHDGADFLFRRSAMQPGRNRNGDAFRRDSRRMQPLQQGRQRLPVRRRAGDIAD